VFDKGQSNQRTVILRFVGCCEMSI